MRSRSRSQLELLEPRRLLAQLPDLHSLAGAEHTIFLDFDGHVVTGTTWNSQFDIAAIHAPPFDADGTPLDEAGNPSFDEDEVARMISIWERMAEDFRPFHVDVTTEDPSAADPDIFDQPGRAQRVIFTSKFDSGRGGTGDQWFHQKTQGIAADSWEVPIDTPAWVFSNHALAGEIGSHEVGHTFGLRHDGHYDEHNELVEYRGEHGSGETRWSPIMGQGNVLSQWSNGQYPRANDPQDDVSIIAKQLGYREDDFLGIHEIYLAEGQFEVEGVIGSRIDTDTFAFEFSGPPQRVQMKVVPWHNGPNLDVGISLLGIPDGRILLHDPLVNPHDALASAFDMNLSPGRYFLTVTGVGRPPSDNDPGYSDYGSLGYYKLTIRIGEPERRGDIDNDGQLTAQDIDAIYAISAENAYQRHADLNEDQVVDQADVDILIQEVFATHYGDLNLDRRVDFADFLVLSAHFGQRGAGWASGDLTGDGTVAFADFLWLASTFEADPDPDLAAP